jgi:hypothetical protein
MPLGDGVNARRIRSLSIIDTEHGLPPSVRLRAACVRRGLQSAHLSSFDFASKLIRVGW